MLSLLGDGLAVALAAGIPVAFAAQLFPPELQEIIKAGGLMNFAKRSVGP